MKGNRMYVDIGTILDEVFDAAKTFGENFQSMGDKMGKARPQFQRARQHGPGARWQGPSPGSIWARTRTPTTIPAIPTRP